MLFAVGYRTLYFIVPDANDSIFVQELSISQVNTLLVVLYVGSPYVKHDDGIPVNKILEDPATYTPPTGSVSVIIILPGSLAPFPKLVRNESEYVTGLLLSFLISKLAEEPPTTSLVKRSIPGLESTIVAISGAVANILLALSYNVAFVYIFVLSAIK